MKKDKKEHNSEKVIKNINDDIKFSDIKMEKKVHQKTNKQTNKGLNQL